MNTYQLATNVTSAVTGASVHLLAGNTNLNNTNNTGLIHVYQLAPNGTNPTITQMSFRIEGSVDGETWARIIDTAAITANGGSATTNTVNGGVFRAVALAPYMRFVCTTAPATTNGTTSGGAYLCF